MMKKALVCVAGTTLALTAIQASAAPRETVTFTNVSSQGADGEATNAQTQHTFTGGYAVGRLRITATLTEVNEFTYGQEAKIRVTPPGGTPFLITPFSELGFEGSLSVSDGVFRANPSVATSAGVWTFQFFESYVDDDFGPDATWNSLQITLDDDVVPIPGDTLATAMVPQGSGALTSVSDTLDLNGPAHMYKIQICQPASFQATTVGGTSLDTQLFLFDANGRAVAANDQSADTNQSTITSQYTASLPVGDYYIAISEWDQDPVDASGAELWLDNPFDTEHGADGPGAANPLANWNFDHIITDGGAYTISLTGACFVGPSFNCVADVDDGTATGTQDGAVTIDDLLFFLAAFEVGSNDADIDNGTSTGTQDGAVTIDDLLFFLVRFEEGC
jgi:hypothetical protein